MKQLCLTLYHHMNKENSPIVKFVTVRDRNTQILLIKPKLSRRSKHVNSELVSKLAISVSLLPRQNNDRFLTVFLCTVNGLTTDSPDFKYIKRLWDELLNVTRKIINDIIKYEIMYSVDEDRFVNCPFDSSHVMKSFRLPRHIVTCKEHHPEIKLKRCPFNWTHLFNDQDLEEHLKVCFNKSQVESSRRVQRLSEGRSSVTRKGSESDGDDDFTGYVFKPLEPRISVSAEKNIDEDHGWVVYEKDFDGWKMNGVSLFTKDETNGNDWSDEELLPLPLPKTTSKAFRIKESNTSLFDWNEGEDNYY